MLIPQAENAGNPLNVFVGYLACIVGKFQAVRVAGDAVVAQLVQNASYFLICGMPKDFNPEHGRAVANSGVYFG
jgi:hypothetical protein